ncbi:hypothetical protein [Paenibacillus sp. MBLB4367]|uniref:hypothetical protein n=1 Tax=Paenibacillus sp. MBLB4367 TaxID=3384767 RepID=UPI00390829B6
MVKFPAIRKAITSIDTPSADFPFGVALTKERLEEIRRKPVLRRFLAEMREAAAAAASAPVEALPFSLFRLYETTGDRYRYERFYFDRRGQLAALALAAFVDQDDAYLEALEDRIWAICDEYTWAVPAHMPNGYLGRGGYQVQPPQIVDLFAAETAHALAEINHLLGDRLHGQVKARIVQEVERRVLQPLFHDPVAFGWESRDNNWASVCSGAAGMAALLIVQDKERLAGMMDRVLRAMDSFLDGYAADGGCPEGISYWTYGFGYFVYFADMLETYTDGRICLLQGDKIRRIAEFPAAVSFAGQSFVSFSDSSPLVYLQTGLSCRLARRVGGKLPYMPEVPSFDSDRCYRFPHLRSNLLWTDEVMLGSSAAAGRNYLDNLCWLIDRRDVNGTLVSFAAKGGHNDEPHNHNDLGQFILNIGGESLVTDLGAGVYDKGYFGPDRYGYLHNSSLGHCVPVINGQEQQAGREYEAAVTDTASDEEISSFELDLTKAYGRDADLLRFSRRFEWRTEGEVKEAVLELTDSFVFAGATNTIQEQVISTYKPSLASDGSVEWKGTFGAVRLAYDSSNWTASAEEIETKDHLGGSVTVHRLRLSCANAGDRTECRLRFACRPNNKAQVRE